MNEAMPHMNKRLKVLWLSHLIPYPPKSGVLMRSYHLLRELAKYHDVDLFAFNQSRQLQAHFMSKARGIEIASEHFSSFVRRFHVEEIPSESHKWGRQVLALRSLLGTDPYTINWLKSSDAKKALSIWLQEKNYDLVHFDTISLAPFFSDEIACPVVLDHHNIESHMMLRRASQERNSLKKLYFKQEGMRLLRYEKNNLKHFSAHIVCSHDDGDRLLGIDNSLNVRVIPNGILMETRRPKRDEDSSLKLLFIGGLDWYPNTDAVHYFLDEIWPLIVKQVPLAQFDIIGKRPTEKMLNFAKKDPRVRVHGFVEDIDKFYREAAVYVCPIRDGGGTKLKVIDALAHRVPLVGWPTACEGLELQNDVHAKIACSAVEFADQTIALMLDPVVAEKLGDTGYEHVKDRFDFHQIGSSLAQFYLDLCKESGSIA